MTVKTIFVIDDQVEMREGLQAFLAPHYDVRCFESGLAVLEEISPTQPPDCILLDLRIPHMDGHDLQAELKKMRCHAPIIFMSGDADKWDIIEAWREGAADFILKPFAAEEIRLAIEAVLRRSHDTDETSRDAQEPLAITKREAQVLLLLGQGLKQQDIGNVLGLSLRTVKMYRGFIKDKLGLDTMVEIARFCDRHRKALETLAE